MNCFQVCSALREELEEEHRRRMEAANLKFRPIVITEEPSKKVRRGKDFEHIIWILLQANFKINAMRIMFELHTLKQRRVYQNMRADQESGVCNSSSC